MFSEFQTPKHEDWLKQIEKELKATPEPYPITNGLFANPFVAKTDTKGIQISKNSEGWIISQKVESPTHIIESLEGGVAGITVDISKSGNNFQQLFENVYLDYITLRLIVNASNYSEAFTALKEYITLKGYDFTKLDIVVNGIELSEFSAINSWFKGNLTYSITETNPNADTLANLINEVENTPGVKLALTLSAVENFYLNIANLKTLLHILNKLDSSQNVRVFVEISSSNEDPNLQAIALTQMAAASIIGGADWIEIKNISYPEKESFSLRITRNIQHILHSESFLHQVDDAAAGSYFMDDLTEKLISQTWEKFLSKHE